MLSVENLRCVARNRRSQSSIASQRSSMGERFHREQLPQMTHSRPFSGSKARRRPTGKSSTTSFVPSDSLQNRQVLYMTAAVHSVGGVRVDRERYQLQRYYTRA